MGKWNEHEENEKIENLKILNTFSLHLKVEK